MFLTEDKIKARIQELSQYRYRDRIKLDEWSFLIDEEGKVGTYPPKEKNGEVVRIGSRWEGRDLYVWLSSSVLVPSEWSDKEIVGLFDFGDTGGGNNSGFESLLFLNHKPYQGVDSNHKEVFIPSNLAGDTIHLDFRLWSGLEGGGEPQNQEHKLQMAELAWLDEKVDHLYFDAKTMIETIEVLDENQPERYQLLNTLNHAINLIDWLNPGSQEFYQSIYQAQNYLEKSLEDMEKNHPVTFHCIGHTHIDVAWLWQLKHTREKSARSFSTVLRLMEKYPEYIFLQTQPQLYAYIKEDYPELYEEMKRRIQEGRWEVDGGMWLESDCNIPSGESLVRQLLHGTQFIRDEFQKECKYLWLPDVFGYSWALPQILKKSGIDTFMTTKISWSQYNRMPHDTFKWRGIDGTEILTHFITTTEPWPGSTIYTYNGLISPKTAKESWEAYRDKRVNQDLLLAYGYGDGGGGVNREMLEMRKRIDQLPGLPHMKTSTANEYFNKLHENVNNTKEYVHTWDGELYLEYHRGTYTSQAFVKQMNRKLELLFRESEWLNVLNGIQQNSLSQYPKDDLKEGWEILLRNQFHDIIPGSSIKEVYEDAREEYEKAEKIGKSTWMDASNSIVTETSSQQWTVFNSAPWKRDDLLFIEMDHDNGYWMDCDGHNLQAQRTTNGWYVEVQDIPSMGYKKIEYYTNTKDNEESESFKIQDNHVETPFYHIFWNDRGQLTSIYDVENGREVLAENERGNVLQVFEDKPLAHDAWDIDIFYQEKMEEITELQSVDLIEKGHLQATIRFNWTYGSSTISQDMILYCHSRRIDFNTHVDWYERQHLLKVAFPVDIRSTEATYDIQFGNVKRPTHWNTSWDQARFETVGHQWADLSEGGYGVSLLNNCKYGYDIKDHVMRLSLIKSAVHPDPYADEGQHEFTYSLFPHKGSWQEAGTVQEAWKLNNPLTYQKGQSEYEKISFLDISNDHVMIDAVKKAEDRDAVVIRLHEYEGSRSDVRLSSDFTITKWQECDLMERPIGEENNSNHIEFHLKPYEIKTFLVEFEK